MFKLGCTSDKIWNITDFIEYLAKQQNQVVDITVFPEAVCLDTVGVYKILDCFTFEQVNIHTFNPFEKHHKYNIIKRPDCWFDLQQNIDKELHIWNTKKKFFCFYHRPIASRLGLAGHLYTNHDRDSLIHFSASLEDDELIQFELDKLLTYNKNSIAMVGNLINHLPLLLSDSSRHTSTHGYYYDDPLTNFYQDILIDIVVETHVMGNTFFPTEKTARPMWLKKPFIVFGSKNYLDYLHQMGFRTFSDFWDESYDGYEGRDRYNKIIDLIDNIAAMSIEQLEKMYWDMTYTLDHNYNLLQQQNYSTKLTQIN